MTILHDAMTSLIDWFEQTLAEEEINRQLLNEHFVDEFLRLKQSLHVIRCDLAWFLYGTVSGEHQEALTEHSIDVHTAIEHLIEREGDRYHTHRRTVILLIETETVLRSVQDVLQALIA